MTRAPTIWDYPSAIPMLRELWIAGTPCTPMARQMSERFKLKVTRNAIIGKVHRLGLNKQFPRTSGFESRREACRVMGRIKARSDGPRPVAQQPRVLGTDFVEHKGSNALRKQARLNGAALIERVETGAGVESLNARPFATATGCRWPLSGGMVCCNPLSFRGYCAGHAAVAYERPQKVGDTAVMAAFLTRFDGVVDAAKIAPPAEDTAWDAGRLAA